MGCHNLAGKNPCSRTPRYEEQPALHGLGGVKQIPYVCHLCRIHSDDIAHPNKLPCTECSIRVGRLCYHYPVMDTALVYQVRREKDILDKKDEAQRLAFSC
jgi:hypothetical protein